jgi:glycosyltransferase involved in cell wall biosynthesis
MYVNGSVHIYTELIKDSASILILCGGDSTYECGKGNVQIKVYKKIPKFRDIVPVGMFPSMIMDRPDVVLIHGLYHVVTLMALAVYGIKGVPIILINRGIYGLEGFFSKIRNQLINKMIKYFRVRVISLTQHDREKVVMSTRIPYERTEVIPIWLTQESLKKAARARNIFVKPGTGFYVLYVGRLDEGKRVDILIKAFRDSLARTRDAMLTIVGEGSQRVKLEKLVSYFDLDGKVRFVGAVPEDKVWGFYAVADILVLPTEREGFSRVILEAFTMGLPVLASGVCGIPEIVIDGQNGYMFYSERDLSEFLSLLYKNPDLRKDLGKNAEISSKNFSETTVKGPIISIIRESAMVGRP